MSVHESSPNLFADLGRPDAAVHMLKAQIVAELYRLSVAGGFADADVAQRIGLSEGEVSRLFRGDFRVCAVECLMGFLTAFGRDIEIVSRPREVGEDPGSITFRTA